MERVRVLMSLDTAVFPVAGFGTRFLPATKASPKEMLPIVNKPLIQRAVEEAIASGISRLIFVTNGSKRAIEDHFDSHYELEGFLFEHGKADVLHLVRNLIPPHVSCLYVRQPRMLGLGHAVLCARAAVGNVPFAVVLADDLIDSDPPCLTQLIEVFLRERASVLAVEPVSDEAVKQYGIVDFASFSGRLGPIRGIVEKPDRATAPSRYGVIGRYILTPQIFEWLEKTPPGAGGEIQLTDALALSLRHERIIASRFEGTRYDCGNPLGFLKATVGYALKETDFAEEFLEFLRHQVRAHEVSE